MSDKPHPLSREEYLAAEEITPETETARLQGLLTPAEEFLTGTDFLNVEQLEKLRHAEDRKIGKKGDDASSVESTAMLTPEFVAERIESLSREMATTYHSINQYIEQQKDAWMKTEPLHIVMALTEFQHIKRDMERTQIMVTSGEMGLTTFYRQTEYLLLRLKFIFSELQRPANPDKEKPE